MIEATLISHFYNEEMLLPYWVKHHQKIFDHAILINHRSTDRSFDIIKEMAPEWDVIDSSLKEFDALLTDFEVEKVEEKIRGWKVCLNTTEFLVGSLKEVISKYSSLGIKSIYPRAMVMVDNEPGTQLDPKLSLLNQKPFGIPDNILYNFLIRGMRLDQLTKGICKPSWRHVGRSRLIHCNRIGGYTVGRHGWIHQAVPIDELTICWFGFSPWNEDNIHRKLEIQKKLPKATMKWGSHHKTSQRDLQRQYGKHKLISKILGHNIDI